MNESIIFIFLTLTVPLPYFERSNSHSPFVKQNSSTPPIQEINYFYKRNNLIKVNSELLVVEKK